MQRRNFLGLAAATIVSGGTAAKVCSQEQKVPKTTGLESVGLKFEQEQEAWVDQQLREAEARKAARRTRYWNLEQFRKAVEAKGIEMAGDKANRGRSTLPVGVYVRGESFQSLPQPVCGYDNILISASNHDYGEPWPSEMVEDGLREHMPEYCRLDAIPHPLIRTPLRICSCKYIIDMSEARFDGTFNKRAAVMLYGMYMGIAAEIKRNIEQTRAVTNDNRWDGPVLVEWPKVVVEQHPPMLECWAYTHVMWEKQAIESHAEWNREHNK